MKRMAGCVLLAVIGLGACKRERSSPFAEAAKACHGGSELSCPRPIFAVGDLEGSLRYYREQLGFKVDWRWGPASRAGLARAGRPGASTAPGGEPADFASVSRGDAVIFLSASPQPSGGAWAMMFTPDVDRLYAELREHHARIAMPPTDMPWGVREMRVADPDGNMMRFGTGIGE